MRKQYKTKKRSCGLCKPYKKGWDNRWKAKDRGAMCRAEQEIKVASESSLKKDWMKPEEDEAWRNL
ncbi:MAG: hypothetical protein M1610_05100 [Nitrospirae bacterium]|nr:hypothetical protein [Nitrospirota bacterium]MDA8213775.1 hypothetical protein [Nitrospiraceae bacterium]MDA8338106.1 hypothetical protein [Nitrospiraceae bacterium]